MGVLHTPSRHTFECDGTQRVFPIPSLMISQDFVRIEIDGVLQSDRKQWDIVNNSLVFVLAPINGAILDVQVASDSESLGELGMIANVDILAQNITNVNKVANNIVDIQNAEENSIIAKEEAWRAEAERLTANSYATEPEDVYVKIYTSNNDGTFTVTDTTDYSSYHWEKKAASLIIIGIIDDVTSNSNRTYSSNKIDTIVNTIEGNIDTIEGNIDTIEGNVATLNNTTVKLTGNETIAGVKTFSSSPVVPTPTTNTQAANKEYVDSKTLNINTLTDKPTPVNTDNLVLQEVGGGLKKVSYENLIKLPPNDTNVKTALNASGTAPIFACRAWVNFKGTGTVAIRASGNVSSITDNGTGNYTVNFTTAMQDANYSIIWGNDTDQNTVSDFSNRSSTASRQLGFISSLKTTSSFTIYSGANLQGDVALRLDFREINISIFR